MSDLLGILETINADNNGEILIMCQPITESAPRDIPEIKEIADEYWTAKIIVREGKNHNNITEWFSIPYENVRSSLQNQIYGPCIINYDNMDRESRNKLFKDSQPIFSINNKSDSSTFRWLDDPSS